MKLHEVQSYVSAQLAADPALSLLGAPLLYSPFTNEDDTTAQIDTALSTKGVCFEVSSVSGNDDGSSPGRFTQVGADFVVCVAESHKVDHTPSDMVLVSNVINAVTKPADRHQTPPRCTGFDSAKDERGYVLHVISFTVEVVV